MSDWFFKSYQTYNNERRRWERKLSGKRFLGDLIAGLFVFIRDGLAYFYLITQIFTGKIGIAQFVFLFPIITSFSDWLISLSTQITELRTGSLKLDYLRNFFDTCNDNRKSKGAPLPVSFNIELKNVSYKYPESDKLILKDINLNIKQNEKIPKMNSFRFLERFFKKHLYPLKQLRISYVHLPIHMMKRGSKKP